MNKRFTVIFEQDDWSMMRVGCLLKQSYRDFDCIILSPTSDALDDSHQLISLLSGNGIPVKSVSALNGFQVSGEYIVPIAKHEAIPDHALEVLNEVLKETSQTDLIHYNYFQRESSSDLMELVHVVKRRTISYGNTRQEFSHIFSKVFSSVSFTSICAKRSLMHLVDGNVSLTEACAIMLASATKILDISSILKTSANGKILLSKRCVDLIKSSLISSGNIRSISQVTLCCAFHKSIADISDISEITPHALKFLFHFLNTNLKRKCMYWICSLNYLSRCKVISAIFFAIFPRSFFQIRTYLARHRLQKYGPVLMRGIHRELTEAGILYFADFGTLLGFVRDKEFMRHDADMDFAVFEDCDFKRLIDCMYKLGMKLERVVVSGRDIVKVKFDYRGLDPEFYVWHRHNDCMTSEIAYGCEYGPVEKFVGFKYYRPIVDEIIECRVNDTITCNIPKNYEEVLSKHYGNWRVKDTKWSFVTSGGSEKKEKVSAGRYFTKVVDKDCFIKEFCRK